MRKLLFAVLAALTFSGSVFAQDVSLGADVVSNYIWRGTKFAGPSVQPYIELGSGDFTIGSWGSFALSEVDVPMENDFYASYAFGDLSLGVTDYYYQGEFTDFSDTTGSHAIEFNVGYAIGDLSFSANYILNKTPDGAGSIGNDMYFEVGYALLENLSAFVGAGDGWHSVADSKGDHPFTVVNVGLSTSKEVKITEDFSIPVSGAVIYNPDADLAYLYVGFSL